VYSQDLLREAHAAVKWRHGELRLRLVSVWPTSLVSNLGYNLEHIWTERTMLTPLSPFGLQTIACLSSLTRVLPRFPQIRAVDFISRDGGWTMQDGRCLLPQWPCWVGGIGVGRRDGVFGGRLVDQAAVATINWVIIDDPLSKFSRRNQPRSLVHPPDPNGTNIWSCTTIVVRSSGALPPRRR